MLTVQINEYSTEVIWQIYLSVSALVYLVRPDLDPSFTKLLTDLWQIIWPLSLSNFYLWNKGSTSVMQSCLKLQLLIPLKMWHCALAISTHSQHSPSLAQDMVLWMGPQIWWESEFMPCIKWTWYRHRSPACWGSSGLGGGWDFRVWLQQWEFYLGPAVSTLDECTGEKNMHGLVCEVRAVTAQDLGVCWTSETYWGQQDFGSQSKI